MSGRLAKGGRIDREQSLRFRFDEREYLGHPGDTLASALLANDVGLLARSFKYHRPRGLLSAGAEEPNALVRLRTGRAGEPNVRATVVELYDGLVAESQNRWPTLRFDVGEINSALAPLIPAGFYYKTFMWPARFWKLYEYVIRRFAGHGRAPEPGDPDLYEHRHAHCDVLVVGGGPAGLAAARRAARAGARVIVVDEQAEFGGSLLGDGQEIDGASGLEWVAGAVRDIESSGDGVALRRTTAIGYHDHNYLTLIERLGDHRPRPDPGQPRRRLWKLRAAQVVLASGAIERPLVFADNDRPGVMLASAAQRYLNRHGVKAGERVVVATNNDSAYSVALQLRDAGIEVPALVELREEAPPALAEGLARAGIELRLGQAVVGIRGLRRVKAAYVMRLDAEGRRATGEVGRIECDLVAMSGGWNPTVHLFSQSGGRLVFDPILGAFLPGQGASAVAVVGAAAGEYELGACLARGDAAGLAALEAAGIARKGRKPKAPRVEAPGEPMAPRNLWLIPTRPGKEGSAKRFVDLQNDVTAADLELSVREGYRSIEHVKRYTTTGMGTDQGKTSNVNALAIVAQTLGEAVSAVGTTTFRPPYTPATFGAIAGRHTGGMLDPVRRTAMQDWHEARGAVFEPVGQWLRPRYYPAGDEDMDAAVEREVKATRTSLGLLDASTLGKIDIQGPDSGELLERIYTNGWKGLGLGRCRYGLMLREDAMVFDDGVTARLGESHFHMTTTSGNAATVLAWLESWLQTEWPELRVYCTSVTEQWAVASLSGPRARDLLGTLGGDIDFSAEAFPFMTWREGRLAGLPARVFRVSFTGELSYEINVEASLGSALWELLMRAGAPWAITPFGTEAMHVLRAEVGFPIVGQETDGTVTPIDLGLEAMVSGAKDFIGKRSLARPDTGRADRRRLVGIQPEDPRLVVPEGAQIVARPGLRPPVAMIGHVTSSYFSPNLGHAFALALVARGAERHGEMVELAWDGRSAPAHIRAPRFFDPDGVRARG